MTVSYCKKLFALLRGITSNHVREFHCLNVFTRIVEKKLKSIIKYAKINIIDIFECLKNIMKYPWTKVHKISIYFFDFLLEKIYTCHNNPEN